VSDDYTFIRRDGKRLLASAPPTLAGKIEVRGLGILELDHADNVPIALIVSVGEPVERLPADGQAQNLIGVDIPHVALAALEHSAPIKVEQALKLKGLVVK
jgi:serine kinase of HPr protein (carbohydrate metabolism regulator)